LAQGIAGINVWINKFNKLVFINCNMALQVRYRENRRGKSPIRTIMHIVNKSNFASIENSRNAAYKLRKIAGIAVRLAAEENRKHGLDAIIIRDNKVILVNAKKQEKIIATLKEETRKYKLGQVFYARKG
jgi:hypothetical protein